MSSNSIHTFVRNAGTSDRSSRTTFLSNGGSQARRTQGASVTGSMQRSIFKNNGIRGAHVSTTRSTTTTTSTSSTSSTSALEIIAGITAGLGAVSSVLGQIGAIKGGGTPAPTTPAPVAGDASAQVASANVSSAISDMRSATNSADLSSSIALARGKMQGLSAYSKELSGRYEKMATVYKEAAEQQKQLSSDLELAQRAVTAQQEQVAYLDSQENDAIDNLKNSTDQRDQAYGALKENDKNMRKSDQRLANAQKNEQSAKTEQQQAEANLNLINNEVDACKTNVEVLKGNLELLRAQLPSDMNDPNYATVQEQITQAQAKLQNQEARLADLETKQQEAKTCKQTADENVQKAERELNAARTESVDLYKNQIDLQSDYETACGGEDAAKEYKSSLTEAYNNAQKQATEAEQGLQQKQEAFDTAQQNYNSNQATINEYKSLKSEIEQLNTSSRTLESEITKQESKLSTMKANEAKTDNKIANLNSQIDANNDGVVDDPSSARTQRNLAQRDKLEASRRGAVPAHTVADYTSYLTNNALTTVTVAGCEWTQGTDGSWSPTKKGNDNTTTISASQFALYLQRNNFDLG